MEIERKWLLRQLPKKPADAKYWIEQFYVSTSPEVRLRRCVPNGDYENKVPYRITIKGEGDLSRIEIQNTVSQDFYEQALDFINLEPIQKHHLEYNVDGYKIEIAVVLNLDPFVYAEVEFDSEEEAKNYKFPWPELVEEEITNDESYKMKNFWKRVHSL